jgi:LPXTG-motif cell wall-anchored protein
MKTENCESVEEQTSTGFGRWGWVFAAGFGIIMVGMLLIGASSALSGSGSTSTGIVIFIGPFPIVFGSGPDAAWLILIGLIIAAISAVLFVVRRRKAETWVG